jgi:Raf kinase inhibitor-like YbhB/YbcL family protein
MRDDLTVCATLAALLLGCGCGAPADPPGLDDPGKMTITLTSPAFAAGGPIPKVHTCDGKDTSPPLAWTGVPKSARSLALVCDDPDAPRGTWTHWLLFNVPPQVVAIPEAIPATSQIRLGAPDAPTYQGTNDFGKPGYGGPCPPGGTHHYVFRLFALDTDLAPTAGSSRKALLPAILGHILAEGKLVGTYAR